MSGRFATPQYRMVLSMFDSFNNWLRPPHPLQFEMYDFYRHAASELSGNNFSAAELLAAFYTSINTSELSVESRQLISNAGLTFLKYLTFSQDSYFWLELSRIYQVDGGYPVNYYMNMPSEIEEFETEDSERELTNSVAKSIVEHDTDISLDDTIGVTNVVEKNVSISDIKHPSTMSVSEMREYSRIHNLNLRGARLKNEITSLVVEHYERLYM